jgi:hypothetical protein
MVVAGRLELGRVLLVLVAQLLDVLVAEQRVLVEVHLGVEGQHPAVAGDHQRVDLDQAGIEVGEGAVHGQHQLDRRRHLPALEAEAEGELAGVERQHADGRVEADLEDLLRALARHLLDLHAAFGRGDHGDAAARPVDQHAEIQLAPDVGPVLDVDALDLLALRPGLRGDQPHAEHRLGRLLGLVDGLHHLDAAALAAAAGVDLRLDHPNRAAQLAGHVLRFLRGVGDDAARHRDAVFRQQALGLILVDVHGSLTTTARNRSAVGSGLRFSSLAASPRPSPRIRSERGSGRTRGNHEALTSSD